MSALAWIIGGFGALILCFAMLGSFAFTADTAPHKGLASFLLMGFGLPALLLFVSAILAPRGAKRAGVLLYSSGFTAIILALVMWALLGSGPGQQVLADDPNGSLAKDFASGNFNYIFGFGSIGLSILAGFILSARNQTR